MIVAAAGNQILQEVWASLGIESRTIITAVRTGMDGHEIAERHRPILEALRSRVPIGQRAERCAATWKSSPTCSEGRKA